ncbi:MAG: PAC2 family protein [Acidimicrobiia bacterium]|nr:PAC2 family protein [Acidimicrobiia bacterium]
MQWDSVPSLRNPVLVAAFTGWNDGADAASDALRWLSGRYGAVRFASLDPEAHIDFQASRPLVELSDGVTRKIHWPEIRFESAILDSANGPDLILCTGPEPNLQWRGLCADIITVARDTGCESVVTFGALLADAPHTRPVRCTGATTDPADMDRLELTRSHYAGPTGITGVLHDACRTAGMSSVSIWAPVPHYVAGPPNPPATLALLDRFATFTGLDLDLRELTVSAEAWRSRIDMTISDDEDLAAYVRGLEEQADDLEQLDHADDVATGDSIAEAFEEYLRDQTEG